MDTAPLRLSPDAAARTVQAAERFASIAAGDPWGFLASEGSPRLDEARLRRIAELARRGRAIREDLDYLGSLTRWYVPVEPGRRRHRDEG
jgi:hypothetical protein